MNANGKNLRKSLDGYLEKKYNGCVQTTSMF